MSPRTEDPGYHILTFSPIFIPLSSHAISYTYSLFIRYPRTAIVHYALLIHFRSSSVLLVRLSHSSGPQPKSGAPYLFSLHRIASAIPDIQSSRPSIAHYDSTIIYPTQSFLTRSFASHSIPLTRTLPDSDMIPNCIHSLAQPLTVIYLHPFLGMGFHCVLLFISHLPEFFPRGCCTCIIPNFHT